MKKLFNLVVFTGFFITVSAVAENFPPACASGANPGTPCLLMPFSGFGSYTQPAVFNVVGKSCTFESIFEGSSYQVTGCSVCGTGFASGTQYLDKGAATSFSFNDHGNFSAMSGGFIVKSCANSQ